MYDIMCTPIDLAENSTLNSEAADLSDLPDGDIFTIDNFTYANSAVVSRMFKHLQETDFLGITVRKALIVSLLKIHCMYNNTVRATMSDLMLKALAILK